MSNYFPDRWTGVKINVNGETIYKIFGTWYGGYLNGDSWRLNSGITSVEEEGDLLHFHGSSGSVYTVHKENYGTSGYTGSILGSMVNKTKDELGATIEVLDQDFDWLNTQYT